MISLAIFLVPCLCHALQASAALTLRGSSPATSYREGLILPDTNATEMGAVRLPSFKQNVLVGCGIAKQLAKSSQPAELFLVKNKPRTGVSASTKLDDFTDIKIEVLFAVVRRPAIRLVKADMVGLSRWGNWQDRLLDSYPIDDLSSQRKFSQQQITMDENEALDLLKESRRLGPWTNIELCVPYPDGPLTYAFKRKHPPRGVNFWWDLVRVKAKIVEHWDHTDEYCSPARPRPQPLQGTNDTFFDVHLPTT